MGFGTGVMLSWPMAEVLSLPYHFVSVCFSRGMTTGTARAEARWLRWQLSRDAQSGYHVRQLAIT